MKKQIAIHLITETSSLRFRNLLNLIFMQFPDHEPKYYFWDLINSSKILDSTLEKVRERPGMVFYHMSDKKLEQHLVDSCDANQISSLSITNYLIEEVSNILGSSPTEVVVDKLDDIYFDKVEAIDFSIKHDDGQNLNSLSESNIILVGLSRSSKTPTSMYLAFNGFKVANIPFINEESLDRYLLNMRDNIVIGLVINPGRLMHIRESRVPSLGHDSCNEYVDLTLIRKECRELKEICERNNWPVVDVTSKSVEETASNIIKIYYDNKK